MDPLPRRRKEGGGEIVEVYGFAGWIASLVAYGEQLAHLNRASFSSTSFVGCAAFFPMNHHTSSGRSRPTLQTPFRTPMRTNVGFITTSQVVLIALQCWIITRIGT